MTTAEAISAGTIPYVHDSGVQQEIVPDPRLRFTDDQFLECFDVLFHLSEDELNEIRSALSAHIQQYAEEVFITRMLAYLDDAQKHTGVQIETAQISDLQR
jgi:hypothetical protein